MAARSIHRLSPLVVARIAKGRPPGTYPDGGGLYLRVSPNGAASWVFRYAQDGREHKVGLGALASVTLADAREKARAFRVLRAGGNDPLASRKSERAKIRRAAIRATTFDECRDQFLATNETGWRNPKHRQQWGNTLANYASPVFGKLPVDAVDVGLVMQVLQPLWATKPETASRLRGRIERILDWAKIRGMRDGENPARWRGHLDHLLPKRSKVRAPQHHAALPYAELPAFCSALREGDGIAARALEFAILTAARTSEVLLATWDEVDPNARVWTVPGGRMKAGRDHRVPLSAPAVDLLNRVRVVDRASPFIFPGSRRERPLSNMALLMTLRRMGRGDLTAHGFRSSFRTWAAERTNAPREVAEAALAHVAGDKVEAAYQRGDLFDKRRWLMEAWAAFVMTGVAEGGDMVPLRVRS